MPDFGSPGSAPHPMLTVNKLIPQGRGLAPALLKRAASVVLDWDTRQKSRFDAEDSQQRRLGNRHAGKEAHQRGTGASGSSPPRR